MQGTPINTGNLDLSPGEPQLDSAPAFIPPARPKRQVTTTLSFLSGCIALLMTGFGIIIPVYPQRLQALGLGAETLALMEAGFGLGMFLFSTPMGTLAARIGRKPVVLLSLAGFVLTNIFLAFVNLPPLFIVVRFLEGALAAGLMPASMAMVGDILPVERQGRWIGIMTTAQAAGIALGPGIGGFLYQSWGFTTPFLLTSGLALIAALLALVMLPETLPREVRASILAQQKSNQRPGETTAGAGTRSMLKLLWLFAAFVLIDFGITFTYPFTLPQYPFFFEKVLHYNAAEYGVIVSTYGLSLAAFPLLLGRISELLPKKTLIVLGCVLEAALNLGMIFLHQYALLIAAAVITGLGSALLAPALGTAYLSATTDQNRSQVMGIRGSALSLAVLLAPLTQAAVSHVITPQISFAIGGFLALFIALFAAITLKQRAISSSSSS
ncbi:MFS transporter [Dictyobacter aurantiacus]|uniref:Tetracycline resistance MFS efflux pump n=1 Tax=Dictyobacter aurantiacus TaxID=1936993 RepID=A0A401ZM70_9CHLR|nr:MFS transporter [Dictyobacter aurantiacus]GCE07914.1 tetracycline resistance MFS efflux pump [Dictyobacter aurantiacus]